MRRSYTLFLMGLPLYFILMGLGTFLAWAAWGIIVWNISPLEAGFVGFALFYVTLTLALGGSFVLLGTGFRLLILKRHEVPSREMRTAFRHAVIFTVVSISTLMLAAQGLLRTWQVLGLILIAILVEYLFLKAQAK